jgi:hypothetical protein
MLALVTIFLITFSVAFITVRIYRAVDGWQGSRQALVGQRNKPSKMSLIAQLGLLISEPRQKAKTVRLRSPINAVKAPWGW